MAKEFLYVRSSSGALDSLTRLGPYDIVAPLGAGGMEFVPTLIYNQTISKCSRVLKHN
jgi:hypothetical protein